MSFDAPVVLLLAPLLGGATWFAAAWARRVRLRRAAAWSSDTAKAARAAGRWGPTALSMSVFLGVAALAGPRWGEEQIVAETRGLNLVFAMDISRSMLAEDARPNRLGRAVREARRLAQDLDGDRMGLIAFAGSSYILSPLSVDASAIALYLDALDPDVASQGGTGLASALQQGRELLGVGTALADRVLVVFTDGEAHDSLPDVLLEAQRLQGQGIHLILVAEGARTPARIPLRDDRGALRGWQQDDDDQVIQTSRRDDILGAVADAAQGTIVAAELPDQAGAVRDLVAAFKRSRSSESHTERGRPRGWIPLLAAATLLLGATLTRRTASLICLSVVLGSLGAGGAIGQTPAHPRSAAEKAWDRGDLPAARAAYLAEQMRRRRDDTAWYNSGTAALAAGDFETARAGLGHAAASIDPGVRFRALYNLGLLELRAARADSTNRDAHLGDAERAYREALLLQPGHLPSKWNLELAIRRRGGRGGGGGATPPPPSGGGKASPSGSGAAPPPPSAGSADLSPAQADEVLRSIGEEELRTRRDKSGRARRAVDPRVKDW
jgi:Ca-activated chloride channel homolog